MSTPPALRNPVIVPPAALMVPVKVPEFAVIVPVIFAPVAVNAPAGVTLNSALAKVSLPKYIPLESALKTLSPEPIFKFPVKVPVAAEMFPLKDPEAAKSSPVKTTLSFAKS